MVPPQAPPPSPPLPFVGVGLLAPMEGVTEPCYRDLVLDLHRGPGTPTLLGGAFTEFVRVVGHPIAPGRLRAHLGPNRFRIPVGIQLMGADLGALAATAHNAESIEVPILDLNFGCPAKGALRGCAGSAILRKPEDLEATVRACVEAVERTPVSAKIRAGFDDTSLLEELARAAESGGAGLLTVHCRTKQEGYQEQVDWSRIARAVDSVAIPVCGNGGVRTRGDFERMRGQTGCAYVMVGQGALADPWIFSGEAVSPARAARFLLDYAGELERRTATPLDAQAKRVKNLVRHWTAGDLFPGETRLSWLRIQDPRALLDGLNAVARGDSGIAPPVEDLPLDGVGRTAPGSPAESNRVAVQHPR